MRVVEDDLRWLVVGIKARGNRPGVSMTWLIRYCRTRDQGRAIVDWLRGMGWQAGCDPCSPRPRDLA